MTADLSLPSQHTNLAKAAVRRGKPWFAKPTTHKGVKDGGKMLEQNPMFYGTFARELSLRNSPRRQIENRSGFPVRIETCARKKVKVLADRQKFTAVFASAVDHCPAIGGVGYLSRRMGRNSAIERHRARIMSSLQGHLLVASPKLADPNFFRAVVLLLRHNEEGAFGVVLNRPSNTPLKDVWST